MTGIVLTDPQPLPTSQRCPRCSAKAERLVASGNFGGQQRRICQDCGYEDTHETTADDALPHSR